MSERKVPRSGAAAVACLPTVSKHRAKMSSAEFPQIDTTGGIRQSDPSGLSSMQNAKMDTPRVATGGIIRSDPSARSGSTIQNAESHPFVGKVRRESTCNGFKSEPSAPVLRTGADGRTIAEHCGVHHDTVAAQRAKASPGGIRHLNDEPRLGRDGVDRKIAAHCGVSQPFVAKVRRESSSNGLKMDTPRVATRNGVEYEIRTAGINANRRPDPREEAAKCVGGTLHI